MESVVLFVCSFEVVAIFINKIATGISMQTLHFSLYGMLDFGHIYRKSLWLLAAKFLLLEKTKSARKKCCDIVLLRMSDLLICMCVCFTVEWLYKMTVHKLILVAISIRVGNCIEYLSYFVISPDRELNSSCNSVSVSVHLFFFVTLVNYFEVTEHKCRTLSLTSPVAPYTISRC